MKGILMLGSILAGLLVLAMPAAAQPPAPDSAWGHGTTVNVFGGMAAGSSSTHPLTGAAFGWEITPSIGIEASGSWQDRGRDADAFAASLTAQAGLLGPHTAVPFIEAGVGFYRASFGPDATNVPAFYSRRMAVHPFASRTRHTFTDPSFVLGGGVNLYVSRHFAVRPSVNATIVRRNSDGHVLTSVALHVAYHFEQHPLMPATGTGSRR